MRMLITYEDRSGSVGQCLVNDVFLIDSTEGLVRVFSSNEEVIFATRVRYFLSAIPCPGEVI